MPSKKKHKVEIGSELFFLYTQLNEIYTLGLLIVAEIEEARDRLARYERENRLNDYHSGHDLQYMIDQQCINLLRLARSVRRLASPLQVLNAGVYAFLVPLLHSKMSIISRVLAFEYPKGVYRPAITYCDSQKVLEILTKASEISELRIAPTGHPLSMGWERYVVRRLDVDKAIDLKAIRLDSGGNLRVSELPAINDYLDKRQPKEQLAAIRQHAEELKKSLLTLFDLSDVLPNVGHAKGADSSSYLW